MKAISARRLLSAVARPFARSLAGRSYAGPDRRGIVRGGVLPAHRRAIACLALGIVGTPLVCVAILASIPSSWLPLHDWIAGLADSAFVSLIAAGLLLMLRWRLVGEVASAGLGAAAGLLSLLVVSSSTYLGVPSPSYVLALRALAAALVFGVAMRTAASPEVRADLRSASVLVVAALPVVSAIPVALSPARLLVTGSLGGVRPAGLLEAAACILAAAALLLVGVRQARLLFVAT